MNRIPTKVDVCGTEVLLCNLLGEELMLENNCINRRQSRVAVLKGSLLIFFKII